MGGGRSCELFVDRRRRKCLLTVYTRERGRRRRWTVEVELARRRKSSPASRRRRPDQGCAIFRLPPNSFDSASLDVGMGGPPVNLGSASLLVARRRRCCPPSADPLSRDTSPHSTLSSCFCLHPLVSVRLAGPGPSGWSRRARPSLDRRRLTPTRPVWRQVTAEHVVRSVSALGLHRRLVQR